MSNKNTMYQEYKPTLDWTVSNETSRYNEGNQVPTCYCPVHTWQLSCNTLPLKQLAGCTVAEEGHYQVSLRDELFDGFELLLLINQM